MFDSIRQFLMLDWPTFLLLAVWLLFVAVISVRGVFGSRVQGGKTPSDAPAHVRFGVRTGKQLLDMLARSGISPNQVTIIGLILVLLNCLAYLFHRDATMLGSGLMVAYVFDTLDGLVARAQGTSTRFGGYLDAVVDRIQETATLAVIGFVTSLWLPAFLVITGSMMTSYNKARAAIEIPISNKGWPDFFNKTVRQFFLCTALIASDSLPFSLVSGLWVLAAASYFTAFQRILRAYFLISPHDAGKSGEPD